MTQVFHFKSFSAQNFRLNGLFPICKLERRQFALRMDDNECTQGLYFHENAFIEVGVTTAAAVLRVLLSRNNLSIRSNNTHMQFEAIISQKPLEGSY